MTNDISANRAERRRNERAASKEADANMAKFKANAERLKRGQPAQGQPQLGQFPPFVPTNVHLTRLDTPDATLWLLDCQSPYGAGRYYFDDAQLTQLITVMTEQQQAAKAGIVIAKTDGDMRAAAENAEQLASGLIVPGR